MNTLMLSLAAMLLGVMISNAQDKMHNHVVTKTDTIFCGKMTVGNFKTKCTLIDGSQLKVKNSEIVRYSNNGQLFEKMPVYRNNEKTGRTSMMEVVKCKNGLTVYKDEHYNGARECLDAYFYFYEDGKCINIQRNPDVDHIMAFIDSFGKPETDPLKDRKYARE